MPLFIHRNSWKDTAMKKLKPSTITTLLVATLWITTLLRFFPHQEALAETTQTHTISGYVLDRDGVGISGVAVDFSGAWSVFPFFESCTVVVSDMIRGLFVLRPPASVCSPYRAAERQLSAID